MADATQTLLSTLAQTAQTAQLGEAQATAAVEQAQHALGVAQQALAVARAVAAAYTDAHRLAAQTLTPADASPAVPPA